MQNIRTKIGTQKLSPQLPVKGKLLDRTNLLKEVTSCCIVCTGSLGCTLEDDRIQEPEFFELIITKEESVNIDLFRRS